MTSDKKKTDSNDIPDKANIKKEYVVFDNGKDKIRLPEELICIEYCEYNDRYSYFDMDPRVLSGYIYKRKAVMVKGETVLADVIDTSSHCSPRSFSLDVGMAVIQKSDNGTDMLVVNILNKSETIVIGEISYDSESGKYTCEGFTF